MRLFLNDLVVLLMSAPLAVALNLSPIETVVVVISVVGFLSMFGIASAKGGYQDLVKTTLSNDAARRRAK